ENTRRFVQALGMLAQFEDLAAISPFPLEYGAGIMQAMRENMNLGVRPSNERTIHPDMAVKLVERDLCHINLHQATRLRFEFAAWIRGGATACVGLWGRIELRKCRRRRTVVPI